MSTKRSKGVSMGRNPENEVDSTTHAQEAGNTHKETRFAEKAPALFWWEHLGKQWFQDEIVANIKPGETVIELGSGGARVVGFLIEEGISPEQLIGFEINPDQVKYSEELYPEASFKEADIASSSFVPEQVKPESVNHVYSSMVVDWLHPEQLKQMAKNAYAALKPEGTFSIMTVSPEKSGKPVNYDQGASFDVPLPWSTTGETGRNYHHNHDSFIDALTEAGFDRSKINIEDLQVSDEARAANPKEYDRYTQYQFSRLAVKAVK